jgi:hypothetical protein
LAELIKLECSVSIELVSGSKGEFTVWLNDEVIAQKKMTFPLFPDIVEQIKNRI